MLRVFGLRLAQIAMLIGFAFIALSIGDWFGEDDETIGIKAFLLGIFLAGLITFAILRNHRWLNILLAIAIASFYGFGFYIGDSIATKAYNECVDRGEEVRIAIIQYQAANGRYPDSIAGLKLAELPGDRFLRPNILYYQNNGNDFTLCFSDWLVSHTANKDGWRVIK